MDADEARRLRTVTEAWAITDLQAGRVRGPLARIFHGFHGDKSSAMA